MFVILTVKIELFFPLNMTIYNGGSKQSLQCRREHSHTCSTATAMKDPIPDFSRVLRSYFTLKSKAKNSSKHIRLLVFITCYSFLIYCFLLEQSLFLYLHSFLIWFMDVLCFLVTYSALGRHFFLFQTKMPKRVLSLRQPYWNIV